MPLDALKPMAEAALHGVGDTKLGEWVEVGEIAFHLRRRLSANEQEVVGPVLDVRGTWEGRKRMDRMQQYLPAQMRGIEQ